MTSDLHRLLHDLADDMHGTDYTALRGRVHATARRIGRRNAIATAAAGIVAVAAMAAGGYALATHRTPLPDPADPVPGPTASSADPVPGPTGPSPGGTPSKSVATPGATAVPRAIPGTLVYLDATSAGGQIKMLTVTDGVPRERSFGTATDTLFSFVPSPDLTLLAALDSPNLDHSGPASLVIIAPGGARHTIATGVTSGNGDAPVWMPDGKRIIATLDNRSSVIDVTTGRATAALPAEGNRNHLTWSANGRWRAFGLDTEIVVTAADGSGMVRRQITSLPECREPTGCPIAVKALSDDGRYVSFGHQAAADRVVDMRTGRTLTLPSMAAGDDAAGSMHLRAGINMVYFRPDGTMIVRTVTNDARELFILVGPGGRPVVTFPDSHEGHPRGWHLAGYRP